MILPPPRSTLFPYTTLFRSSGRDASERYREYEPAPALVVPTSGGEGGTWTAAEGRSGKWAAAPLPGPVADAYGCGDSFVAGLTFALADGRSTDDALAFASRCGAACLTGRGPYEGQLTNRSEERRVGKE